MSVTGVRFRRNTRATLDAMPPVEGEMVYATDTGEIGYLRLGTVVWVDLSQISAAIPEIDWASITGKPDVTITVEGGATGSVILSELNSGTLTLTIDPDQHSHNNVYYTKAETDQRISASADEVTNELTALIPDVSNIQGIPAGGLTGEILTKTSDNDYAANWSNNISSVSINDSSLNNVEMQRYAEKTAEITPSAITVVSRENGGIQGLELLGDTTLSWSLENGENIKMYLRPKTYNITDWGVDFWMTDVPLINAQMCVMIENNNGFIYAWDGGGSDVERPVIIENEDVDIFWSSTYASDKVTIYGDGLTVEQTYGSNSNVNVGSEPARNTGKWYFEAEFLQLLYTENPSNNIGVKNISSSLFSSLTNIDESSCYGAGGWISTGGLNDTGYATYTVGDKIGVAFDADTGYVDYYKNGTFVGTSIINLVPGEQYVPGCSMLANGDQCRLVPVAEFSQTVPDGYIPWGNPNTLNDFKYWRLRWIESSEPTPYPCGITQLEFRESGVDIVPDTMVESTESFASSTLDESMYGAWVAFNGSLLDSYVSSSADSNAYLGYNFGTEQNVDTVGLYTLQGTNDLDRAPISFVIEGSNDFYKWHSLKEVYGEPTWDSASWREYSLDKENTENMIWDSTDNSGVTISVNDSTITKVSGIKCGAATNRELWADRGKQYVEFLIQNVGDSNTSVGFSIIGTDRTVDLGQSTNTFSYRSNGTTFFSSTYNGSAGYDSYANGDVIGLVVDFDNGTLEFFKNNVSQGVENITIGEGTYTPAMSAGVDGAAIVIRKPSQYQFQPADTDTWGTRYDRNAHKFWRILITSTESTDSFKAQINELEFRYSNGTPSLSVQGTAIGSSTYGGVNDYASAFDGDSLTGWASETSAALPQWIGYEHKVPVTVSEVMIQSGDNATRAARAPIDFDIQYSDNGIDWFTEKSVVSEDSWLTSENRIYKLSSPSIMWSGIDKHPSLTLDDGNQNVISGTTNNVRAGVGALEAAAKSTGKWYTEFKIITSGSSQDVLGLTPVNADRTIIVGNDTDQAGYFMNAYVYIDGATQGFAGQWLYVGDVLGIEMDFDAGSIEFFRNGVSVNSYTYAPTVPVVPAVSTLDSGSTIRIRTPDEYEYTPTAGFEPWEI